MKKPFAWSSIPNLEVRGKGRWLHARLERDGAAFGQSLRIAADPAGANAEFARAALDDFKRRLSWCCLWAGQNRHRFPNRTVVELVRAALADPALQAGGAPSVALDAFGEREHRRATSLGALRQAWLGYSAAQVAAGNMTATTAKRDETSLLRILRLAGRSTADSTSVDVLTSDTLTAFDRASIARVAGQGRLALNRARNTIASTARQARSLFSRGARTSPEYRALNLPRCVDEFVAAHVQGGEIIPEKMPAAVAMERLRRGRALMRRFAPRHWFALVLEFHLGLRAGEATAARWDWFVEVETVAGVRTFQASIVLADDYGPKGLSRRIVLDAGQAAAWREVMAARLSPAPHILVAETTGARAKVLDRLGRWLRAIGLVTDAKEKPNHKLRKLRASLLIETHGLEKARGDMGHGSAQTTRRHYELAPRSVG